MDKELLAMRIKELDERYLEVGMRDVYPHVAAVMQAHEELDVLTAEPNDGKPATLLRATGLFERIASNADKAALGMRVAADILKEREELLQETGTHEKA